MDGMEDWHASLDHCMPELIRRAARDYGDAAFIVGEDGTCLSFAGLERQTGLVAAGLIATGIAIGDRVAIWAPNSAEWIVAACAIEAIGAIMVPINTRFRGTEAGYVLEKSGAKALFTVPSFLGNDYVALLQAALGEAAGDRPVAALPALSNIIFLTGEADRPGVSSWDSLKAGHSPAEALADRIRRVTPGMTCDILFTSGTTGHPKGAMHSHGQSLWMAGIWNRSNDLRRGDRALIVNPFFHSFGYRAGWVSALLAGMTVYPVAVFDVDAVLARIAQERISVLMGPPTLFSAILDHPKRAHSDLSSLRVGHTGSSNIPVELIVRARDELAFDLFLTSYGLTEATALVSVCYPEDSAETIARTVGHALPGTELRIVDETGRTLAEGERGELLVRGPNVMQGYFEDQAATAEAIDAEGWLHTGDLGSIGADGTLRIHDRLKDIVIVGGFNAYPAEIEHALAAHPTIAEVAVIAIPDERMGEVCGACVVLCPGATLTLAELTAWARDRLANFKVPRHLYITDALPRTPLGKVQKFLLRQAALAALSGRQDG
jgi:acyl-CoA synthetase (AMP-forming)/AMP-acid ligase II